jgi:hypothetical protein
MTPSLPRLRYTIATAALVLLSARPASSDIIASYNNVDASAQAVIDTAIGFWDDLLPDTFAFNVDIGRASFGGLTLARSSDFVELGGRPISATITIDDGTGALWFVDDTPADDAEFHSGRNPFHAIANRDGPAAEAFDLLTVVQHELAHAIGFSAFYGAFAAHLVNSDDGNRDYVGSTVTARLTAGSTHILPEAHPFDLMNPELLPGHRLSPSPLDLAVLHDAFGYDFAPARPLQTVPEAPASLLMALSLLAAVRHLIR